VTGVERLLDLVSPRTGLIKSLNPVTRGADEPSPPYLYHARLANFDFRNVEPTERVAAGKGLTRGEAIGGAIGEAVERYCAYHVNARTIRRARQAALNVPAIGPGELVMYSPAQCAAANFPYPPWNDDNEIGWTAAHELPGGREILVPAFLVYMNYSGPSAEDSYCAPTSNGLAAGPDLDHAILGGLCELAERDGFLLHWMNRLPAPEVEFGDDGPAGDIRRHYRRFGIRTHVFNISTGLPMYAMMAVSLGDGRRDPAVLVGLGCHLDPAKAVLKALFEICQVRPSEARRFRHDQAGRNLRGYSDVKTLHDHSAFLMLPERLHEMAFFLESGNKQKLADLENRSAGNTERDLARAVEGLTQAGCRVAYADLTTADVRPFNIRVVRTLVTSLQPMHFGWGEERLGGARLFDAARKLGYASETRTAKDLNPCPHPLA
jgi:ribosomal protein S12 methylthiotransferase accessory factor